MSPLCIAWCYVPLYFCFCILQHQVWALARISCMRSTLPTQTTTSPTDNNFRRYQTFWLVVHWNYPLRNQKIPHYTKNVPKIGRKHFGLPRLSLGVAVKRYVMLPPLHVESYACFTSIPWRLHKYHVTLEQSDNCNGASRYGGSRSGSAVSSRIYAPEIVSPGWSGISQLVSQIELFIVGTTNKGIAVAQRSIHFVSPLAQLSEFETSNFARFYH